MAPPAAMRGMMHAYGRRAIFFSLGAALTATVGHFVFYVQPRHAKYEHYFATYDPYDHMKYVCEHSPSSMHTCPTELAKLYEEKGKEIAPLQK